MPSTTDLGRCSITPTTVVWGQRLFVTGADKARREVYCLDLGSGRLLWRTPVAKGATAGTALRLHEMTGYAAPTAATDGERVYAIFPTGHLVALNFAGKLVWQRRFDMSKDMYGHATSLVLQGNLLYVQIDLGRPDVGLSHLVALNKRSGKTVWTVPRPVQGSWTTPLVINTGARQELITSAKPWVIAYDPATGAELWNALCINGDTAPSPIYAHGYVIVANIYAELTAIRPGGEGDVTKTRIAWSVKGDLPDICSPLSDGKLVWVLSTGGVLSCHDAANGALVWKQALGRRFRASPSLVGDRVYLISEAGESVVVGAGREYRELATGQFGEPVYSSPAFANGRMYVRGEKHLFGVGAR